VAATSAIPEPSATPSTSLVRQTCLIKATPQPPDIEMKKPPAFTYESKAAAPHVIQNVFKGILDMVVPHLTISDLLAISPELRKEAVDHCRTHQVPTPVTALSANACTSNTIPPLQVEHATPLWELRVTLNGVHSELGLLDEGFEIVVIHKNVWRKTNAPWNQEIWMRMQTANRGAQDMGRCIEMLEIDVEGIKTWTHVYIVPDAPYRLLLGRPWQQLIRLLKNETKDVVTVTICDPLNSANIWTCQTLPRPWPQPGMFTTATSAAFCTLSSIVTLPESNFQAATSLYTMLPSRTPISRLSNSPTCNALLQDSFTIDPICHVLAYKKVANRVKPVATTMPAHAQIIQCFPEDPLLSLLPLSQTPPEFQPGVQLTKEQMSELGIFQNDFLWDEEKKLAAQVLMKNKSALAWDEREKGQFRDDYFPPIVIPTIEHTTWVHRQPPIPPGICDEVISLIKSKIASGVYKASNSSYQSRWFCVAKKNSSVRIVHDLQPLNAVTIKDAATLPYVELFTEQSAGRSIYTMMDLFVCFDHHTLSDESHDLMTFQTPLGTFRLTVLPQGWMDSPTVFHNNMAFILQHEIDIAPNFQDDINILGPRTRYETSNNGYETIPNNLGTRRFVWEHCLDVDRVLHHLKHAGATISAKKLYLCVLEVIVVG
jgi:hypothetical protein